MKLRCISDRPTDIQVAALGSGYRPEVYALEVDREYVAVALWFYNSSPIGSGTFVDVRNDSERLTTAPLCLFEITDARISPRWRATKVDDEATMIGPPHLLRDYYYDHLSDGDPATVRDFSTLVDELENE